MKDGITTRFKRSCLRFKLRSLLLLTLVFCVVLGWHNSQARRQRDIAHWIVQSGGTVYYDYQVDDNGQLIPNAETPIPRWLTGWLGIDFFDSVVHAEFGKYVIVDGMPSLEPIDISPLAGLKHIKWLYISSTPVSDFTSLAKLTKLGTLRLSYTEVQDVTSLAMLVNLKRLYLDGTQVRDLSPLSGLTSLQVLHLHRTQVEDVSSLASLVNLRELRLHDTQICDATPLAALRELKKLTIQSTPVHLQTVRHLKNELPQCVTDLDDLVSAGLGERTIDSAVNGG